MEALNTGEIPQGPAGQVLVEHARLIRTQRFSEQIGAGLKILTGLLGVMVAAAMGVMVWQASNERGLVIEAFSVPPDLAEKGLTGQVLASQLEDKLSQLQARTDSGRAPTSYSNDWGHDIRVEIPQTGVSISELQRWLRQWLGHQTRVGGEVFRTPQGLKLTVRAGGDAGDSVVAPEADLDSLIARGAEALFARTQPYRYGVYLNQNGRTAEARAVLDRLAATAGPTERAWALTGLAGIDGMDARQSLAMQRQAVEAGPDLALAWVNISSAERIQGHIEAAHAAAKHVPPLVKRQDRGSLTEAAARVVSHGGPASLAEDVGDYAGAIPHIQATQKLPSYFGSREASASWLAFDLARLHDIEGARAALPPNRSDAEIAAALARYGGGYAPYWAIADALGDWPEALRQLQATESWGRGYAREHGFDPEDLVRTQLNPQRATALARLGRLAEAQALAAELPTDCYDCLRARGTVAALAGEASQADRWFAEAVRQGPSLPQAHRDWAEARIRRGDAAGAILEASRAAALGPRWADAQAVWGEALMAQGEFEAAAARFQAADALAPKWGRNHLRWGEALWRAGRTADARRQFLIAKNLGFGAADRAALGVLLSRIGA
jgi:tetratricopeptide (TPR) repeat protein